MTKVWEDTFARSHARRSILFQFISSRKSSTSSPLLSSSVVATVALLRSSIRRKIAFTRAVLVNIIPPLSACLCACACRCRRKPTSRSAPCARVLTCCVLIAMMTMRARLSLFALTRTAQVRHNRHRGGSSERTEHHGAGGGGSYGCGDDM